MVENRNIIDPRLWMLEVNRGLPEIPDNVVVAHVLGTLDAKGPNSLIVLETPPIYCRPDPRHPVQSRHSQEFAVGSQFIDNLAGEVGQQRSIVSHLVDDLNGCLQGEFDPPKYLVELAQQTALPIFNPETSLVFSESVLAKVNQTTKCTILDASFQQQKIIAGLSRIRSIEELLIVIAHPAPFISEQIDMFQELASLLKQYKPFQNIPKGLRPQLLSNMFRHVWFNKNHIVAYSQPIFDNGVYKFQRII